MNNVQSRNDYPEQITTPQFPETIKEHIKVQWSLAVATSKEIGRNLLLGNESVKHASKEATEKTLKMIDTISTNKIEYNTNLNQWQITQWIVGGLKNIQTKIVALTATKQPVEQSMIDIANMFINEYQIQSKTYSNLRINKVEWPWIDEVIYANAA